MSCQHSVSVSGSTSVRVPTYVLIDTVDKPLLGFKSLDDSRGVDVFF